MPTIEILQIYREKLKGYEQNLNEILSGFIRTRDSYDILSDDQFRLHSIVNELYDLLNNCFGENQYSQQIIGNYNTGKQNFFHSSSYNSVSYIKATVGAAISKIQNMIDLGHEDILILQNQKENKNLNTNGDKIFIGHGNSNVWRELKDFIQDRLKLHWEEFNRVPQAGRATKERLEELLNISGFAFLVMTAEDEQRDGTLRARENVVHEIGLFQGRLGFQRAIILVEEGCEEFSNIHGVTHIPFPKSNISASFEEVRRTLEREGILNK